MADLNTAPPALGEQQGQQQQQQQQQQQAAGQPAAHAQLDAVAIALNLATRIDRASLAMSIKQIEGDKVLNSLFEAILPMLRLAAALGDSIAELGPALPGLGPIISKAEELKRTCQAFYASFVVAGKVNQHHLRTMLAYYERQTPKVLEIEPIVGSLSVVNDKDFKAAHKEVQTITGTSPLALQTPEQRQQGSKRSFGQMSSQQHSQPYSREQRPPMGPMYRAQGPQRGGFRGGHRGGHQGQGYHG